ncbi:adenosylcobinamide-GDP ribazoletransferase [Desulfurivibrio alkaliphilus]|uniref:Adenosylcobinamide-GDP ribazoletransferase n=1 Tax=Desulfurivibrio alkaliphilus (strain DSM 19089 / UNIQEM U267 / AHT2) TaxID=589865 RepID=D6Z3U0_DESAT|nr:adenosylcobinamide-GDP ribazoletransferase [Desulfurivibrio alkaliphilus]ADH86215.1 cobalamin 5'-phosphate synthase [Desulfurivibrio alkaliphilus AHT 2]
MLKDILPAARFLTIVPLPGGGTMLSERAITRSAAAFVAVGLLQGLLLIGVEMVAGRLFHPDLALWLVVLALVLVSGGFHLDGLADTFDALAVKSSGERERDLLRRLEVMKDSATGVMGLLAIFFALILKYYALKELSHSSYAVYYSSLLLLPAFGKWAMVTAMYRAAPARPEGLGRLFIGAVGRRELLWNALALLLPLVAVGWLLAGFLPSYSAIFYLLLPPALYLFGRLAVAFSRRQFGGMSGDTLGAVNELAEILFLLLVLLWLRLSVW